MSMYNTDTDGNRAACRAVRIGTPVALRASTAVVYSEVDTSCSVTVRTERRMVHVDSTTLPSTEDADSVDVVLAVEVAPVDTGTTAST